MLRFESWCHFALVLRDLTGDFCTSRIETGIQKGTWENAEEDVHAGANRAEAPTDRSADRARQECAAGVQGGGDHRADLLPVAERIRRPATGASQKTERFAKRERPVATSGSRSHG